MNEALLLLSAALSAVKNFSEVATQVTELITTARAEGRDVTPEELDALRDQNNIDRAAWDELMPK